MLLLGAAIIAAIGYFWITAGSAGLNGGGTVTVPTATAASGEVVASLRLSGTVAAARQGTVAAPRMEGNRSDVSRGGSGGHDHGGGASGHGGGGPAHDFQLILTKLAQPGTAVKTGDVVAEFDRQLMVQRVDDYKDALTQQQAQVKAQLAQFAASREAHAQSVRNARARWQRALQDLKKREVSADIDGQLFELAARQTEAAYKQLQFEDELVAEQERIQIYRVELNRRHSELELQRSEANLRKMTLRAPIDGIVVLATTVRNGEFGQYREGDEVRNGAPLMYIVDPSSMVLNASANQVDAHKLRMGMKARIRLDAYPDIRVDGRVDGIGAMSKSSTFRAAHVGVIPVRLRLEQMDQRIIPDLTASADLLLAQETNALVLPRGAVFEQGGSNFVFLRRPEGWTRRQVDLGVSSFTTVAVRSGLREGDVVALEKPMEL